MAEIRRPAASAIAEVESARGRRNGSNSPPTRSRSRSQSPESGNLAATVGITHTNGDGVVNRGNTRYMADDL